MVRAVEHHLAQVSVSRLLAPLDSPLPADSPDDGLCLA
jgi:hypothetical protein